MIFKPLHIRFLAVLRSIVEDKKNRRVEPSAALSMELVDAMHLSRAEIERLGAELAAAGVIQTGETITQKFYILHDEQA